MLGESNTVLATSGEAVASAEEGGGGGAAAAAGGGSSYSGEDDSKSIIRAGDFDEGGEKLNYGANRWPRQETLALLKIRSDMDTVFRDSTPKGPLWDEVSRKLAELGYNRSAKKCKEKFENVYKYHKRTKEGRTGTKSEGKTYRFFDQLQALDHLNQSSHNSTQPPLLPRPISSSPAPPTPAPTTATPVISLPWTNNNNIVAPNISHVTITADPISVITPPNLTIPPPLSSQPLNHINPSKVYPSLHNLSTHLFSSSTSSSTDSDEDLEGGHRSRKRKRKWKDFFERLTRNVIKKQEELQRKFLETVEKHEQERMLREESWRIQEMARINREHEILIQERSTAAAKDAAVLAILQKVSGQQYSVQDNPQQPPQPAQPPLRPPAPVALPPPTTAIVPTTTLDFSGKRDNGEDNTNSNNNNNVVATSSSRWPKAEVEALIGIRTSLDVKYQENGPKGPLWEEISTEMQKIGYNRSSKRCKEKWENINKYFKKVKESNKKRPEDSKTCPYFHQLDALYKIKSKNNSEMNMNSGYGGMKPNVNNAMEPLMVQPEQQWPLPQEKQPEIVMEDDERGNMDQNFGDEDEEDEEDDVETEEDEEDGGGFEVVPSKPVATSMGATGE